MAIITAGTTVNNTSGTTGQGSWNLTTAGIGDLFVYFADVGASTPNVSGLSASHVTNWQQVGSTLSNATVGDASNAWIGVANAVTTAAVTVSFSGAIGTHELQSTGMFLHAPFGPGTQWVVCGHTETNQTSAGTAVTFPSLTPDNPSGTGIAYVGYAAPQNAASAGSTSGFTYLVDGFAALLVYNLNGVGGAAFAPTATMTSGQVLLFGMMIAAYPPSVPTGNRAAIRRASLY
jgi:hypothetical protein